MTPKHGGEVFAMTGGKVPHIAVATLARTFWPLKAHSAYLMCHKDLGHYIKEKLEWTKVASPTSNSREASKSTQSSSVATQALSTSATVQA